MRSKKNFLGLVARGLGMGAADVVPGVSGGTIAFITGIYEEFLETIANLKFSLLKTWKKEGFKAMWKEMNGNFILAIFLGIFISVLSLSKLLKYLLEFHEVLLWSFFFGLILASVWLMAKTVQKWNALTVTGLIAGTVTAYFITILAPAGGGASLFYIFFCGMLAICAMILPGVSGSFILLLLGVYTTVLGAISGIIDALKEKDWALMMDHGVLIGVFIVGCIIGLIAFSKILNTLFKKSRNLILSILTGFLIGSLNKIWPWKETRLWGEDRHGHPIPIMQSNVSPQKYSDLFDVSSQLTLAVVLMITGACVIVLLDKFGNKDTSGNSNS